MRKLTDYSKTAGTCQEKNPTKRKGETLHNCTVSPVKSGMTGSALLGAELFLLGLHLFLDADGSGLAVIEEFVEEGVVNEGILAGGAGDLTLDGGIIVPDVISNENIHVFNKQSVNRCQIILATALVERWMRPYKSVGPCAAKATHAIGLATYGSIKEK